MAYRMPMPENFVPLILAPTTRVADAVERILEEEKIAYEERLDVNPEETSRVCYLGTMFLVAPEDLDRSRRILTVNGLTTV